MHFKKDFRLRLVRLCHLLLRLLDLDRTPEGFKSYYALLPLLFSVYSSLWGNRIEDLIKK